MRKRLSPESVFVERKQPTKLQTCHQTALKPIETTTKRTKHKIHKISFCGFSRFPKDFFRFFDKMLSQIGLVGLAVMGQNLALNIAEKGFNISVWNRSPYVFLT